MTEHPPSLRLLVLKSAKTEAVLAFYTAIGLSFKQEQHGTGPKHHSAQIGATVFELYPLGGKDVADPTPRLGFAVDDLGKTLENLSALNGAIIREPEATAWGRRAVVHDPDGRSVELYERTTKEE
jgi:lactoylglutathione lyase